MKKATIFIALAALLFFACGKGQEFHYTEIIHPSSNTRSIVIWADQTRDSIVFASSDSWTLTSSDPSWCSFDPEDAKFENKYDNAMITQKILLTFTPNTTGKLRSAVLRIDGGESANAAYYAQVPYLGITHPSRLVSMDLRIDSLVTLTAPASAELDSVEFEVFSNWTLTALDGSWVTPQKTSGKAGVYKVFLDLKQNTVSQERRDTLLLTSNGITDSIPVLQQKFIIVSE